MSWIGRSIARALRRLTRVLSAAKPEQLIDLSMTFFKAAWVDDLNISEAEVVGHILGDEGRNLLEATQDPQVKEKLKRTTQDAIDKGAFGAPNAPLSMAS